MLDSVKALRKQTKALVSALLEAANDNGTVLEPLREVPPELSSASSKKPTVSTDRISWRSTRDMARSKANKKRVPSPCISPERKAYFQQSEVNESRREILNRDNEFFDELQKFRKLYPELCTRRVQPRKYPFKTSVGYNGLGNSTAHPQLDALDPPIEPRTEQPCDEGYYYNGYFQLDDRLRPVKIDHPFKTLDDADLFGIEGSRNLAEHAIPVKVSVPRERMENIPPKLYKAHRRNSFEPLDSISIGDFLHNGFKPFLKSAAARRDGTGNVSLKQEIIDSRRKKYYRATTIDQVFQIPSTL